MTASAKPVPGFRRLAETGRAHVIQSLVALCPDRAGGPLPAAVLPGAARARPSRCPSTAAARRVARQLPAHGERPEFRAARSATPSCSLSSSSPSQLALALAMGMMLQKMERGRDIVLWIWTIPLGVSDLAAGLVWLAIMQNTGYLNTALFRARAVDGPTAWLNSETPGDAVHRHRARRNLARDGDRPGHPRRRPAAHPQGVRRGGRDLRRVAVDKVPQDHPAAAEAEPADRR